MNKLFLALSVSLITGLTAQECCKQPCCPTPPEPVCCECFVPNYYDLQCDTGLFFYGDFLYWYANEDNLSPCETVQGNSTAFLGASTATFVLSTVRVNHLGTKWDPGFRAALGYNFDHDGWDLEANYTWYHNKKRQSFNVPLFGSATDPFVPTNGQLALLDPWINTSIFDPDGDTFLFNKVSSLWKLNFNQIDLELGRKFWLSQFMAIRAYAGVRGALFTTRFNNLASDLSQSVAFATTTLSDQFKNRIWGVGLLTGIQPEWHFSQRFIFFSNLDAALLWGRFKVNKREDYTSFNPTNDQTLDYHNIAHNTFHKMQAVLDLALGFRWEETWCYRIRTALDIGWEHHIWFDVNNRSKTFGTFFFTDSDGNDVVKYQNYSEEPGNLMMGGLVTRFRVDF